MTRLRALALEPWDAGSHRAFLDGWVRHSRHEIRLRGLAGRHFKWRMRHAALTFADALRAGDEAPPDVIWASSMLSLAEWRSLAPRPWAALPHVLYFHENQLTYPVRRPDERDLQLAFTNLSSALAADAIWWNSAWHREDFLQALEAWMARVPDHRPPELSARLRRKSRVLPPGLDLDEDSLRPRPLRAGPLHLVWAARWEHDKGPELLEDALAGLPSALPWRLSLLGQRFREVPAALQRILERHADRLVHRGPVSGRRAYLSALRAADVFVSTAHHEFFGVAAAEAIACGCAPLLPARLAYPELLGADAEAPSPWLYDATQEDLTLRLRRWVERAARGEPPPRPENARRRLLALRWAEHAPTLDAALEEVVLRASHVTDRGGNP